MSAPLPKPGAGGGRSPKELRYRLLLIGVGVLMSVALAALGEALCRRYSGLQFLGSSPWLFVGQAFGSSIGHAPNMRGRSFEAEVITDALGFRVGPATRPPGGRPAVLVLGDSVAFGTGVEEPATVVGRLRASHPEYEFLNSAVIGYSVRDYENVSAQLLERRRDVRRVLLVFCLNDLTERSAELIRDEIERVTRTTSAVDVAKKQRWLARINAYLRKRSKLYLWLKNRLTDPVGRYFQADLELYQADEAAFDVLLAPLDRLHQRLRARSIPLTVLLLPYAAQVRSSDDALLAPQRRLAAHLSRRGIDHLDASAALRRRAGEGEKLFLVDDAMHLSDRGHHAVAEMLEPYLKTER